MNSRRTQPDMFLDLAPVHAFAAVRAGGLSQAIVLLPNVSPHIGNPFFLQTAFRRCHRQDPHWLSALFHHLVENTQINSRQ